MDFLHDVWVMKQPLASHIGWVDIHDIKLRVKDFWSNLGLKFDSLYTPIPSSMKENIDIIIPYFDGGEIGQHNNKLYKRVISSGNKFPQTCKNL